MLPVLFCRIPSHVSCCDFLLPVFFPPFFYECLCFICSLVFLDAICPLLLFVSLSVLFLVSLSFLCVFRRPSCVTGLSFMLFFSLFDSAQSFFVGAVACIWIFGLQLTSLKMAFWHLPAIFSFIFLYFDSSITLLTVSFVFAAVI